MATTTNFNWTTPNDTDLVKDGAAAIRTLGNSIDTSFVDLKGGTTGQVLAKASATDLDFSWVAQDDSNAIQNAIVDAKGDIIAATAADTPARLAVGTNGQVLTADSTAATGLKWASAGGGDLVKITSGSFSSVSSFAVDSVFSSTYKNYRMIVVCTGGTGGGASIEQRFRTGGTDNTTANYFGGRNLVIYSNGTYEVGYYSGGTKTGLGRTNGTIYSLVFDLYSPFASEKTMAIGGTTDESRGGASAGGFNATTSFDGIKIINENSNNMTGTYIIYGYGD